MRYRTNCALSVKGDRVEKNAEIELSVEEAAAFDPKDISPVSDAPETEPEPAPVSALGEMTAAQLKKRAEELGLSVSGSKADLLERISLHLSGTDGEQPKEEGENTTDGEQPKED